MGRKTISVSCDGTREYVNALSFVARLKGMTVGALTRAALDALYENDIKSAELLLANSGASEYQNNQDGTITQQAGAGK